MKAAATYAPSGRARVTGHIARAGLFIVGVLYLVVVGYMLAATPASTDLVAGTLVQSLIITGVPFVMGILIRRKDPGHIIGTLFLIMGFAAATAAILYGINHFNANASGTTRYSPLVDTITLTIGHFLWMPGVYIPLFIMPLYFPSGQLLSPRWRPLVWLLVFIQVWYALAVTLHPWPWPAHGIPDTRSWNGIAGSEPFFDFMTMVMTAVAIPIFPLVILAVVLRYRRATLVERAQMRWPLFAIALVVAVAILYWQVPGLSELDARAGYPLTWTMSMLFPLSIGVAILRHRLWEIDLVINRALVYGGLTALLVATYLLLVVVLGALFHRQTSTISGLLATAVIALLFQPLHERLQRTVDRLLYGERQDPGAILTRLVQQMEMSPTQATILPNLVQTIARALKVPYAAIWLPDEGRRLEPAAVFGEPATKVQSVPLCYRQETIGRLVIATPAAHGQIDPDQQALLATIATLTAPTVRALQLSEEVSRSRHRIVRAREDERRRLRRDLHDGLGPQLASQTLGLEAVSQLMRVDPEKAQVLLDSLKAQAEEATFDVRRIVYNLRPPALDDLGLLGALRQIVAGYETSGLHFEVAFPAGRADLPAAVETAIFRIAQEAITNVIRHAAAAVCNVHLFCADGYATLEVRDDGRGLRPGYRSGVGVQAMRERTAELGGELLIAAPPGGGTLVRARLPLEADHE